MYTSPSLRRTNHVLVKSRCISCKGKPNRCAAVYTDAEPLADQTLKALQTSRRLTSNCFLIWSRHVAAKWPQPYHCVIGCIVVHGKASRSSSREVADRFVGSLNAFALTVHHPYGCRCLDLVQRQLKHELLKHHSFRRHRSQARYRRRYARP